MALEAGYGANLPLGDRYYGPAEWARQGGGPEGDFEQGYLGGTDQRDRVARERLIGAVLAAHPDLDASDIEVHVEDAEVTLDSLVADRTDRRLAEDIVADISGVRDVQNRLRIRDR